MNSRNQNLLLIRYVFFLIFFFYLGQTTTAQSAVAKFRQKKEKERKAFVERQKQKVDSFRLKKWKEFQDYRKKRNQQLMSYMSERWIEISPEKPIPAPKKPDPVIPPTTPKQDEDKGKSIEIPHGDVLNPIPPAPKPQEETPVVPDELKRPELTRINVSVFGTMCAVAINDAKKIKLENIDEKSVAKAWGQLDSNSQAYEQIISDCCALKEDMHLNGWAMLNLCKAIADNIQGEDTNESAVVLAYLMNQFSYDVHLCKANNTKLLPIYASNVELFFIPRYKLGGKIYNVLCKEESLKKVVFYEKVKYLADVEPIGFDHAAYINFDSKQENTKQFTSKFNGRMTVNVGVNQSLMDYYESVPLINDWSFYARQPMSPSVKAQVIPSLKRAIAGKPERDAANDIIHFVQSAFKYEVDEKQFGRERTFFKEELFYHPYSDCEDRAILFSDLIRQLLGLDAVLLHYENHLATAVKFNTSFSGHYLEIDRQKYMICDPTCQYSEVGYCPKEFRGEKPEVYWIYK